MISCKAILRSTALPTRQFSREAMLAARSILWKTVACDFELGRYFSSAHPIAMEEEEDQHQRLHKSSQTRNNASEGTLPARRREIPSFEHAIFETRSKLEGVSDRSPSCISYMPGQQPIPITSELNIISPKDGAPRGIWPAFRLMDEDGTFRSAPSSTISSSQGLEERDLDALRARLCEQYPGLKGEFQRSRLLVPADRPYADINSNNTLFRAYRQLIRLREMDTILLSAQRQGRISFYMACRGEEAIHMGAASALDMQDPLFVQYREQGLLMWRGFTLEQFTDQCFSNNKDLGKGRQMPVHYGSRALNYHTVSSPLGTQMPQSVGAAYRLKLSKMPNVAVCFFGEGCASTTDFHSALNFAATLRAPVIFVCRNNGYAISTPSFEQYAGDGVVARAPGYGMAAIRVDGNDLFAVHAAVREARQYALENQAPVLIEAMTYRLGHHSTSDDSSGYRKTEEVQGVASHYDPISRIENFLQEYNWLNTEQAAATRDEEKLAVLAAVAQAEQRPKPSIDEMFTDVYKEKPESLIIQEQQLHEHMAKYPDRYQF